MGFLLAFFASKNWFVTKGYLFHQKACSLNPLGLIQCKYSAGIFGGPYLCRITWFSSSYYLALYEKIKGTKKNLCNCLQANEVLTM